MALKTQKKIVDGVKKCTKWWIIQRRKKLEDQLTETMSINPFMTPFLFDYHNLSDFEGLADLIIASHLMVGHNTGFGKLVDEKILPNIFGAKKLDSKFRKSTEPFGKSCFDEIDHIIERKNGDVELLSLKAGRWTIQLTMAVQLNKAFNEIINHYSNISKNIVVGVFYGKKDGLTDKYDILRGVNRGANHDVIDLTKTVHVYAGREFWSWLNDGADETQEWVLQGIEAALKEEEINKTAAKLLAKFKSSVVDKYDKDIRIDGKLNWNMLLRNING